MKAHEPNNAGEGGESPSGADYVKALALVSILLLPVLSQLFSASMQMRAAAIAFGVMLLWLGESIPVPATALLIPVLSIASGIQTAEQAFSAFGSQIIFLLMGSFMLARAMQAHRLDERMAYWLLGGKLFERRLERGIAALSVFVWIVSMWMSNTAACAMFVPVFSGIARQMERGLSERHAANLRARLMLSCAFIPSIGGLATPVGSLPNALAIQLMAKQGMPVSFFGWVAAALPISVFMLAAVYILLRLLFPLPVLDGAELARSARERYAALGKLSQAEIVTAACFFAAVSLWIAPGLLRALAPGSFMAAWLEARLPLGSVAVLAASLLFVIPRSRGRAVLSWTDAKEIDWGTVVLFGGGLCLGSMMQQSGLAGAIAGFIGAPTAESSGRYFAAAAGASIAISELASNTASASFLIPVILSSASGEIAVHLTFAAAIGAGFGFTLPISTPPNAIVYGTGMVKTRDMFLAGILLDLMAFGALCLLGPYFVSRITP